jgi:hypothetical protein
MGFFFFTSIQVSDLSLGPRISDMRIVPVGSSGKFLGSFWFLKMTRENQPFGGYFLSGFTLLYCTNEAKSWWQPQIEATYMRKYHGDSLICLALHIIKPK